MVKLNLQTFLIIDAVFVDLPDVFDSPDDELFGLDALPLAGFKTSWAVEVGLGAAVLIEIIQTDNHKRK